MITKKPRKHIVHINRSLLAKNIRCEAEAEEPAIIVRYGSKKIGNCDRLDVHDKDGNLLCSVVTSYKEPLVNCSARAWIEVYGSDIRMVQNERGKK